MDEELHWLRRQFEFMPLCPECGRGADDHTVLKLPLRWEPRCPPREGEPKPKDG